MRDTNWPDLTQSDLLVFCHVLAAERYSLDLDVIPTTDVAITIISWHEPGKTSRGDGKATNASLQVTREIWSAKRIILKNTLVPGLHLHGHFLFLRGQKVLVQIKQWISPFLYNPFHLNSCATVEWLIENGWLESADQVWNRGIIMDPDLNLQTHVKTNMKSGKDLCLSGIVKLITATASSQLSIKSQTAATDPERCSSCPH